MSRQAQLNLRVAAGILRNEKGQVLLAERLQSGPLQGLWEFPGGKIAAGETALEALRRELTEELGIAVLGSTPFLRLSHEYNDRIVDLEFFLVDEWQGEAAGLEGQRLRWVNICDLDAAELLPADAPLVDALRQAH